MGLFLLTMAPKKTDASKAEPKGKKPVPKKTADKAPAAEEKKAPSRSIQKAQKVQKKIVKGTHGTQEPQVPKEVDSFSQSYGCPQYHQTSSHDRVGHEED